MYGMLPCMCCIIFGGLSQAQQFTTWVNTCLHLLLGTKELNRTASSVSEASAVPWSSLVEGDEQLDWPNRQPYKE